MLRLGSRGPTALVPWPEWEASLVWLSFFSTLSYISLSTLKNLPCRFMDPGAESTPQIHSSLVGCIRHLGKSQSTVQGCKVDNFLPQATPAPPPHNPSS